VGREPEKKHGELYHRCNAGWWTEYVLFDPLALVAPDNIPRCPRCGERETVRLRALTRVIDLEEVAWQTA
jgi:hypothetical protein